MEFSGLCLLILFHILKELFPFIWPDKIQGAHTLTLVAEYTCSPVAASSIKCVEQSLKAMKLLPQVGNKFPEFRIPNSPVPCKVCSENVISVSLDILTSCEYSRM